MSKATKYEEATRSWRFPNLSPTTNIELLDYRCESIDDVPGLYALDLLPSWGEWIRLFGANMAAEDRDRRIREIVENQLFLEENRYRTERPRSSTVITVPSSSYRKLVEATVPDDQKDTIKKVDSSVNRDITTAAILQCLENPTANESDLDAAVLLAGGMKFDVGQLPALCQALAEYIGKNRLTTDDNKITTVGSAARKYALCMDENWFEEYAQWLIPGQTDYLSPQVELELVKGICWRLAYVPVAEKRDYPQLKAALFEISSGYINTRFLLQENYAAIAMNAVVSVFLLDALANADVSSSILWQKILDTDRDWFTDMVLRRIKETANAVDHHDRKLAEGVIRLLEDVHKVESEA